MWLLAAYNNGTEYSFTVWNRTGTGLNEIISGYVTEATNGGFWWINHG